MKHANNPQGSRRRERVTKMDINRKVLELEENIRGLKKSIDGLYFIVIMLGINSIIMTFANIVNK